MNAAAAPPDLLKDRAPEADQLRHYSRKKLALASQLRALIETMKKRGSEARLRRAEALMVKLAEDRFTLAVLGQFKRGKSSLMNAIIGRELLPTGVLPLTSAITVLQFGPVERLVVRREGSPFPEIVPTAALSSYVTENGNPGNRRRVKTATLEVPLPFLRRGLEFVDTPGIGSAIEANTATTHAFLPECDAAIFVTSVDTPLTASELDFLRAIREHVAKLFFVVNKIDLAPNEREREEVLRFIRARLQDAAGVAAPRIFPLSARLALTNAEDGMSSGLADLQAALATFLSEEKAAVLLRGINERALRLIAEETGEQELQRRAQVLPAADRQTRLDQLRRDWEELARKRENLIAELREAGLRSAEAKASAQLDEVARNASARFSNDLNLLVIRGGWRLGEGLAERWAGIIARRSRDRMANWLREFTPALQRDWHRLAGNFASSLETNLREISALAASTFDLKARAPDDVLPRVAEHPAFSNRVATLQKMPRVSRWMYWVPARLVRQLLEKDLREQSLRFLAREREQALTAVADAVRRMAEDFARRVGAAAGEMESRLTAAITGETGGDNPFAKISQAFIALREDTAEGLSEPAVTEPELAELIKPASPTEEPRSNANSGRDLPNDLKTRGCAVCDHLVGTAFNFFAHWQYTIASDQDAQAQFAREHGFCPLHMWQLHAVSSSLGESIGLARLVEQTSTRLKDAGGSSEPAALVRSLLRDGESCRVCQLLAAAEKDYVSRLATLVSDETGRESFARSQGLCLRHLARLLPHLRDDVAGFVLSEAARHLEENAEDMQSYAIKREALRRTLGNKDEEDAAERALIHFAGAKEVCTPWPEDREI